MKKQIYLSVISLVVSSFTATLNAQVISPQIKYNLTIHTPNIKQAGTDATITIRLKGTKASHSITEAGRKYRGYKKVKQADGSLKMIRIVKGLKLEKGSRDKLSFQCPDLGELKEIMVSHNNKGPNSGWYLGGITVEYDKGQKHHRLHFPCQRWLAKSADDGQLIRYLKPEGKLTRYIVTVYTGSRKKAGTDARVRLDLEGTTNAQISSWQLDGVGDPFEKGNRNAFNVYSRDLGNIRRVRIAQDGTGKGSGWFLNKIIINKVTGPRKQWTAHFDRWLDSKNGQSAIKVLN